MIPLYVWLATVAVVTTTVAPLARREMIREKRRAAARQALREIYRQVEPTVQAMREAFQQMSTVMVHVGDQFRQTFQQVGRAFQLAQAATHEDRQRHQQHVDQQEYPKHVVSHAPVVPGRGPDETDLS